MLSTLIANPLGPTKRRTTLSNMEEKRDPDTGVIHGGVLTAVLDNASGMAVPRAQLSEAQRAIATLDLRIDYMRPAKPLEDLLVEAECYQLTRAIAFG